MMDKFIDFLNRFNLQIILFLLLVTWCFFYYINSRIEAQAARTDRLYEMFIDLFKDKINL